MCMQAHAQHPIEPLHSYRSLMNEQLSHWQGRTEQAIHRGSSLWRRSNIPVRTAGRLGAGAERPWEGDAHHSPGVIGSLHGEGEDTNEAITMPTLSRGVHMAWQLAA